MKILFANVPADGHFNPLTGIAIQLKNSGHDVRWYAGNTYAAKIEKLGIQHYRFQKAIEITDKNTDDVFPERKRIKSAVDRLKFDLKNYFLATVEDHFADISQINKEFAFDVLVSDQMFCAATLVKTRLNKLNVVIGVMPYAASSKSLPPAGLGMQPSYTFAGWMKQNVLRWLVDTFVFAESTRILNKLVHPHGIKPGNGNILNIGINNADLYLQSGVPGFEYKRADITPNFKFAGALLPHKNGNKSLPFFNRFYAYKKILLVTQGTFENDPAKLIIPTLEAFANSPYLIIATTGGSKTAELRERFPHENIIIEDFIDFDTIMPFANVYITNGGYGGVMMSINHRLPMVAAGLHEGKLEITARIGYFKIGLDLKTESPRLAEIKNAVEKVLSDRSYAKNISQLSAEFKKYNSRRLCEHAITALYNQKSAACGITSANDIEPAAGQIYQVA